MSNLSSRITVKPDLCGGRPTIRGLRIRVSDILDLLAAGASRENILADYPYLVDDDITAALEYASAASSHRVIAAEQLRFLIDAQLPPALARCLADLGHDAVHVADVGLEAAPDSLIWAEALKRRAVIITKDEDFVVIARKPPVPQVLWIRLGNMTRAALLARVQAALAEVIAGFESGESIIELR